MECQLEDGEISQAEVIGKATSYKTAFIEGILCGSQLYIDSAFAYWDRNFLLENGREPSNEELISWQTEEVIERYVKGGFKQFEEMDLKTHHKRHIFDTFMEIYENQYEYGIQEGNLIPETTRYIKEELEEVFPDMGWTEKLITNEIEQINKVVIQHGQQQ